MTYGRAAPTFSRAHAVDGAAVSHSAELVRGDFGCGDEGPLIRSCGPPSPQGEKGSTPVGLSVHARQLTSSSRLFGPPRIASGAGFSPQGEKWRWRPVEG
jgi:hypothetical protein